MKNIRIGILAGCLILSQLATAAAAVVVSPSWRLDAQGRALDLPTHFRVDAENRLSGSGQPTFMGLSRLYSRLREETRGDIYLIDLRQESHGYAAGTSGPDMVEAAISWHTARNAGNRGMAAAAVEQDEAARLAAEQGSVLRAVPMGRADLAAEWTPIEMYVQEGLTERRLATQAGFRYARIAATDMTWPEPQAVDAFVALVRSLPPDTWLHLHCQAGQGRTTTFLAMAEILRAPDQTLAEILAHQHEIGGIDLTARPDYAQGIRLFYDYVEAHRADSFMAPWSVWLENEKK